MNRRGFLRLVSIFAGAAPFVTTSFARRASAAVVETPTLPTGILLGYKGDAFLETGIVYAPYIPFIVENAEEQWNRLIKDPRVEWNDFRIQYLIKHL